MMQKLVTSCISGWRSPRRHSTGWVFSTYKSRSSSRWLSTQSSSLTNNQPSHSSPLVLRKMTSFSSSSAVNGVGAGWFLLLVAGCFFISPVRSQFGFFGPLLPPATIYNISTSTVSLTVGTICYVPAMANITECRRKRGIEEQPYVVDGITGEISPSQVLA